MKRIPDKLRAEMDKDPYYKTCCVGNVDCEGGIEWHHAIINSGSQLNKKWAIVPACDEHHDHNIPRYIRYLRLLALERATDEELFAISKARNWHLIRDNLRETYKDGL